MRLVTHTMCHAIIFSSPKTNHNPLRAAEKTGLICVTLLVTAHTHVCMCPTGGDPPLVGLHPSMGDESICKRLSLVS